MSNTTTEVQSLVTTRPDFEVTRVAITAPLQWLRRGIDDFRRIPGLSLLYGLLFAGLCAGVDLMIRGAPWYTLGYLTGLLVVGPFLAAGLYIASRDFAQGASPGIGSSLRALGQRRTHLALFSVMLALVMAAWVRFSALLFALKFSTLSPSVDAYRYLLTSTDGWIALAYFVGIGFVLATVIFIISAVAIPLIIDKDVDFISAIQTSYRAVMRNPAPMALWAALIVALTALGVLTLFIGLAIVFPILGYATWHSYRALVK